MQPIKNATITVFTDWHTLVTTCDQEPTLMHSLKGIDAIYNNGTVWHYPLELSPAAGILQLVTTTVLEAMTIDTLTQDCEPLKPLHDALENGRRRVSVHDLPVFADDTLNTMLDLPTRAVTLEIDYPYLTKPGVTITLDSTSSSTSWLDDQVACIGFRLRETIHKAKNCEPPVWRKPNVFTGWVTA